MQKYGHDDARPVLERASARETAARVALGEVARQYLSQAYGIEVLSHVVAIGPVSVPEDVVPEPADRARIDEDPVRCLDPAASAAMVAEIDAARKDGDTLGGVVEVVAYGLPPGLGSHVHWDRRLDGRLAGALMSIQAIKGVEVGDGFTTARRRGSQAHDEIELAEGGIRRRTNRAGGIEGGMSTGEVLRVRAAMKPISTVPRALATVDVRTGEPARAINQRSDVTAVPAAGVVAEAMVALVLAGDRGREVRGRLGGRGAPQLVRLPELAGDEVTARDPGLPDHRPPPGQPEGAQAVSGQAAGQPAHGPAAIMIGPPGAGKTTVGALVAAPARAGFRGCRRGHRAGGGQAGQRHLRPGRRGGVPCPRARGPRPG